MIDPAVLAKQRKVFGYVDPKAAPETRAPPRPWRRCELFGCSRKHYAKGMCFNHYKAAWLGRKPRPRPRRAAESFIERARARLAARGIHVEAA